MQPTTRRPRFIVVGLAAVLTASIGVARASDLPVVYNVQDKPLKAAPSGTQLTFMRKEFVAHAREVR